MAKYLQIALNRPLPQTFTYKNLSEHEGESLIGHRVDVNFGNSKMKGFVIDEFDELPENLGFDPAKIRAIKKVIDKERTFTEETIEMAKWVSNFYICAIGEAISIMVPGGKRESELGGMGFSDSANEDFQKRNLSEEQQAAVEKILGESQKEGGKILHYLYGATGTGKTEVFLSTADKIIESGKGVIYLVPEISLTKQVVDAVQKRFGDTAAILHSALTPSQRLKEWNRILNREARIVVGARSAIFAPVPDLGLVIIDEEHDGSYKSGSTPRYHARQVAMHRCFKHKIPLLMGSATPSVEAWKMMDDGTIVKHTLTKRLAGGAMPEVKCIDLSKVPGDTGSISPELRKEIDETLSEKRQTILFLNRRGFSHYFRCNTCGFDMKCKNCSVSMTLHKKDRRLRCHYCGWSTEQPDKCPECGSLDIGYSGFGTEYIENEVKAKFPLARVLRLDTDSVSAKELPQKIDEFKNGEYDILLGTQMVAKGLNFPNLKLVGVIQADTGLHMPDFRASERTFSLITQVAGRAGRFFPDGKVLVQTYNPLNEPIDYAVHGETEKFYESEIEARKMTGFPPFSRMIQFVFRSSSEEVSEVMADKGGSLLGDILDKLKKKVPPKIAEQCDEIEILGPSECPVYKINDNYRNQIILRGQNMQIMQAMAREFLYGYKTPGNLYIECDVDPVTLI